MNDLSDAPTTEEPPRSKHSQQQGSKMKGSKLFKSLKLKKNLASNKKFQKLFGNKIPDSTSYQERVLIDEFSCALLRNKSLLLHGTLYTTQKYFAFHSNIFGYETYLMKEWTEV